MSQSPNMAILIIFGFMVVLFSSVASDANPPSPATNSCLQFNFGDSNSDTGGSCAATGDIRFTLPGRPFTCRASDGMLYIDYVAESLGSGLLRPYMNPLHNNFSNGANFAIYGMTAQMKVAKCYHLMVQVNQFQYLKYQAFHMTNGTGPKITEDGIRNAIFSVDIGQNDLADAFLNAKNQQEIKNNISVALTSIEAATKKLYHLGARKFVLYNTGPLGCLPYVLGSKTPGDRLDGVGCLAAANDVARDFNKGLQTLSAALRTQQTGAIIVDVNMFDIKYKLVVNSSFFGFYNPLVQCLTGTTVCLYPTRALIWDGVHYTDAGNRAVAAMVLSGVYASQYMRLHDLCHLNISYVPQ